jgi:hypothetical protein
MPVQVPKANSTKAPTKAAKPTPEPVVTHTCPAGVEPAAWLAMTDEGRAAVEAALGAATAATTAATTDSSYASVASVDEIPADVLQAYGAVYVTIASALADCKALRVDKTTKAVVAVTDVGKARAAVLKALGDVPYVDPAGRVSVGLRVQAWSTSYTLYADTTADPARRCAIVC